MAQKPSRRRGLEERLRENDAMSRLADELRRHGPPETRDAFGIAVPIAPLDDVLRSKRALDRPKDREVVRELSDGA